MLAGAMLAGAREEVAVAARFLAQAARFHENLQTAPERAWDADGVEQPRHRDRIRIFEVQGGDLDGATATALANPDFGPGGGTLARVDLEAARASGRLAQVDSHAFDTETKWANVEDPRFTHLDDTLPAHQPLDPDAERTAGRIEGGVRSTAETARDAAVVGATATQDRPQEGTPGTNSTTTARSSPAAGRRSGPAGTTSNP